LTYSVEICQSVTEPDTEAILAKKTIAILAMPGAQLLDVSGPMDVFAEANSQSCSEFYSLVVVGSARGHIRSSSGVKIVTDLVVGDGIDGRFDTLLVAGTPKAGSTTFDKALIDWLRRACRGTRRYGSVCSGALLLAETGLLDGKRVTTHWAVAEQLAANYPRVRVESDAIHVRDGRVRTAAGVTAGMDLALALIEEDLGRDVALKVAAQLVMFFKRPGGQMQFSRSGHAGPAGRSALQEIQRWIAANPSADHSVAALAKRMDLSPRHFARLFRAEVGMTPAAWVEEARVAAARGLLENGEEAPKRVAARSGFTDANTFRRAFVRHVGVTPADYRKRFSELPAPGNH
jgi:transcriptional regulator GlxA family with amidase domain